MSDQLQTFKIPYKSRYDGNDIQSIIYPELYRILNDSNVPPFSFRIYAEMVYSLLNRSEEASRFFHLIYGPPNVISSSPNNREYIARLDLFAMLNRIDVGIFKSWYFRGTPDVNIYRAIKKFLLSGILYVNIDKNYLNNQLSTIFEIVKEKPYVALFDGDNLYYHIGSMFKILSPDFYSLVFFKKNNISPIYIGYSLLYQRRFEGTAITHSTIEAYGARKDAADTELITATALLKVQQSLRNLNINKYYVITGDEYASELVRTTNEFFGTNIMTRFNSQKFDFTDSNAIRNPWTINPSDFPINIYGELNGNKVGDKLRAELSIFGPKSFNELLNSTNPSTRDPTNSFWFLDYIKSLTNEELSIDPEYYQLVQIILTKNISSYRELIRELGNYSQSDRVKLLQNYLVLIGAKYFTMQELIDNFLYRQRDYLNNIKFNIEIGSIILTQYNITNDGSIRINDKDIIREFFLLDFANRDIFDLFFEATSPMEAYLSNVDICIALGIKNIDFGIVNPLRPEQVQIHSFTFK